MFETYIHVSSASDRELGATRYQSGHGLGDLIGVFRQEDAMRLLVGTDIPVYRCLSRIVRRGLKQDRAVELRR